MPSCERRYLIIPGIRSSRIYVIDTKPDPTQATIHKIIEPEEVFRKTGYSRPAHGPLRPGRHLRQHARRRRAGRHRRAARHLHHGLRDLRGARALGDRPRRRRTCTTTSGGTCRATTWCRANGRCRRSSRTASSPRTCSPTNTGTGCISGICAAASNVQTIDLGANHQMALEVRPAHDPVKRIRLPRRRRRHHQPRRLDLDLVARGRARSMREDRDDPARAGAEGRSCRRCCKGFGAVPPLVSDIDLSLDDRFLYVACWGTGEMRQYDVTDPMKPKLAGCGAHRRHRARSAASERQGLRRRAADGRDQPRRQARLLDQLALLDLGRPVLSRRRARRAGHGRCRRRTAASTLDEDFCVEFPDGYRSHQIRLEGGDCSTDSFCYPSA